MVMWILLLICFVRMDFLVKYHIEDKTHDVRCNKNVCIKSNISTIVQSNMYIKYSQTCI
jgi:hypothetical protein